MLSFLFLLWSCALSAADWGRYQEETENAVAGQKRFPCRSSDDCAVMEHKKGGTWFCDFDFHTAGWCEPCGEVSPHNTCEDQGFITQKGTDECNLFCASEEEKKPKKASEDKKDQKEAEVGYTFFYGYTETDGETETQVAEHHHRHHDRKVRPAKEADVGYTFLWYTEAETGQYCCFNEDERSVADVQTSQNVRQKAREMVVMAEPVKGSSAANIFVNAFAVFGVAVTFYGAFRHYTSK